MRIVKKPDGIGENPGRIDNNFCPDLVLGSGFGISQDGAIDLVAVFRQCDDLDIVGGLPSLIEQGAEDRYCEASIIELAIQVENPALKVFCLDIRQQLYGPATAQDERFTERKLPGERVVELHAGAIEGDLPIVVSRDDEL